MFVLFLSHPYLDWGSWFPEFPAMWFDKKGFCDQRGAMFVLYSLHLKTSPWFPGAGWRIGGVITGHFALYRKVRGKT